MEENRPGEYLPVIENERGTFIMNSKDLCMIEHLPDMIDAGIDSLKIEGRMKTALYVATVIRAYRNALDDYFESPEKYEANKEHYMQEICKTTYRPFTTGFFYRKPNEEDQIYDNNTYASGATYIGTVGEFEGDFFHMTQKNKFSVGEEIEIMKPNGDNIVAKVLSIKNEYGEETDSAPHAKEPIQVKLSETPEVGDILRRVEA
jgi:putative protease